MTPSFAALAGLETAAGLRLMPHQRVGIDWLRATPRALLADDPGLGKSAQALLAAKPPVLIIAPAMLAGMWRAEVAKWRPEWGEDDWVWTSYSSLCRRVGRTVFASPREEYKRSWGTVICDEAHYLKSRKAKWTQAAQIVCAHAGRVCLLTGTPVPNWAHELYMPLRLLHGPGDAAYRSYWRWIDQWFDWVDQIHGRGGNSHREIMGLKAGLSWHKFAADNHLNSLMLRRRREDVLADLPPLTETYIEVPMVLEQRRVYEQLKADYFAFVEASNTEIAAFSDGGLHIKLCQATTGIPTLLDDPQAFGSCKLEALRELLEEREGAPVVVFCHFRATARAVELLGRSIGRRAAVVMGGITQSERDLYIDDFQSGRIDLLIGTLETLAEGVTLTRSSTAIFVERSWRPARNEQAMRRVHRISQTAPVTCIYIVTEDSIDQRMTDLLAAKEAQQIGVMRAAEFARLL